MDVSTAFLIPDLPEEEVIYMKIPKGAAKYLRELGIDVKDGQVAKLKKCIYGLKQASKCWNKKVTKAMKQKLDFSRAFEEACLFVRPVKDAPPVVVVIWVDDFLLAGITKELESVSSQLSEIFPMKDLGFPSEFTGINL